MLTEPRNSMLKQYEKLMAMEGVALKFAPAALREMARLAASKKTGARGLRAILEGVMMDIMFNTPSLTGEKSEITITKAIVEGLASPLGKDAKKAATTDKAVVEAPASPSGKDAQKAAVS